MGSHKDRARRIVARYGPFDPDRESLLMEDEHGMEDCDQAELLDDLAFMVSGWVVVVCCVDVCVCARMCVCGCVGCGCVAARVAVATAVAIVTDVHGVVGTWCRWTRPTMRSCHRRY